MLRVGRQPSQFFSFDEDFETSSPLKWFYSGCLFHAMHWGGMTCRAMFWTLSSLLLLVLAAVPHVVDAHSMVGHIVAM